MERRQFHTICRTIEKARVSPAGGGEARFWTFNSGMTMFKLVPVYLLVVFVLDAFNCRSAFADSMRYRAPGLPERHVIEVVRPPYSGNFIINGTRFVGRTRACLRWVAGERIRLVAGDWHGRCADAVFYNYVRRNTCRASCGGW
jgi:hypothetical protein